MIRVTYYKDGVSYRTNHRRIIVQPSTCELSTKQTYYSVISTRVLGTEDLKACLKGLEGTTGVGKYISMNRAGTRGTLTSTQFMSRCMLKSLADFNEILERTDYENNFINWK